MFALLLTPSEAAPAPAPAPAPQALESLLLAKLLFLKGYLVGQYLHGGNNLSQRSGRAYTRNWNMFILTQQWSNIINSAITQDIVLSTLHQYK